MTLKLNRKFVASSSGQAVPMTEIKNPDDALHPPTPAPLRPRSAHAPTLRPPYAAPLRPSTRTSPAPAAATTGALPNTVIIGAMKCGTTSLHTYLDCHPSISMSERKETNFFVHHKNWSKGLGWYRSHFTEDKPVIGESSPNYTRYPVFPGVPERMHRVIPNAKLIFCVRDPIKRMVSHYVHSYSLGRENRPIEEAFRQRENNPYLLCSAYYYQLEQYLQFFDHSQIKLVVLEDLHRDPLPTLQDVFGFLGVDPSYEDSRFTRASQKMPAAASRRRSPLKTWMVKRGVRGVYWTERHLPWLFGLPLAKPTLSAELRCELQEKLAPDVEALRAFSGLKLESWTL